MARPINWLLSPLPVLKLSTLVTLLLNIIFFLDGRDQWFAYKLVFFMSFIFILGILFTLVVHYFDISRTNKQIPWMTVETLFNTLGFLACLAGAILLFYDYYLMNFKEDTRHHRMSAPVTIGKAGWTRRVLVVIIDLIVAGVLFLLTLGRIKKAGLA